MPKLRPFSEARCKFLMQLFEISFMPTGRVITRYMGSGIKRGEFSDQKGGIWEHRS